MRVSIYPIISIDLLVKSSPHHIQCIILFQLILMMNAALWPINVKFPELNVLIRYAHAKLATLQTQQERVAIKVC
jgi:hypothetical protein